MIEMHLVASERTSVAVGWKPNDWPAVWLLFLAGFSMNGSRVVSRLLLGRALAACVLASLTMSGWVAVRGGEVKVAPYKPDRDPAPAGELDRLVLHRLTEARLVRDVRDVVSSLGHSAIEDVGDAMARAGLVERRWSLFGVRWVPENANADVLASGLVRSRIRHQALAADEVVLGAALIAIRYDAHMSDGFDAADLAYFRDRWRWVDPSIQELFEVVDSMAADAVGAGRA